MARRLAVLEQEKILNLANSINTDTILTNDEIEKRNRHNERKAKRKSERRENEKKKIKKIKRITDDEWNQTMLEENQRIEEEELNEELEKRRQIEEIFSQDHNILKLLEEEDRILLLERNRQLLTHNEDKISEEDDVIIIDSSLNDKIIDSTAGPGSGSGSGSGFGSGSGSGSGSFSYSSSCPSTNTKNISPFPSETDVAVSTANIEPSVQVRNEHEIDAEFNEEYYLLKDGLLNGEIRLEETGEMIFSDFLRLLKKCKWQWIYGLKFSKIYYKEMPHIKNYKNFKNEDENRFFFTSKEAMLNYFSSQFSARGESVVDVVSRRKSKNRIFRFSILLCILMNFYIQEFFDIFVFSCLTFLH